MWIFGYGSLVWRPALPFSERRVAYIEGWARRFWQGSPDHRGVPEAPGRVVTLVPNPGGDCWGVAYRVPAKRRVEVLEELDYREKEGYERLFVDIFLQRPDERVRGLMYVATPTNPNYLGPATMEQLVAQVMRSHGPSGTNLE